MSSSKEIQNYIKKQNQLDTLRFITCGSVDDGKSTLLGRMLYEAQLIFDDQVDALVKDSKRIGTQGDDIDFALLVDGLAAEREQGITIDVAYRYFTTEKRKFIVADSPGHEEFTRNMITAASNAELAIILIDARKGVLEQTKRHSYIADMVGIKNVVVAVNKMDLVSYKQAVFEEIKQSYSENIANVLGFSNLNFIPISALKGDNITAVSKKMKWYKNEALFQYIESVECSQANNSNFVLPVQMVLRPEHNFRGFSGKVSAGSAKIGDKLYVANSKKSANISEIYIGNKHANSCSPGQSTTICLDKEIDISRGNVLLGDLASVSFQSLFNANIIWFDQNSLKTNSEYILKLGSSSINSRIIKIKDVIDINSYKKRSKNSIKMNDIFSAEVQTDQPISFTPYKDNRDLGSFILIDKISNQTIAAGVINFPLRRAQNIKWHQMEVNKEERASLLGFKSRVIWFTGLSGSGKSTICNLLEKKLHNEKILTYCLDGDNLRHGLNIDLGFSEDARIENIRRVREVAKILYDSGVMVLASFISPYEKDRMQARKLFPKQDFIEVYLKCDLTTLETRDPKGLYRKARLGEIPNFTGISSPYEEPNNPDLTINTKEVSPQASVEIIYNYLKEIE